jgi:oligoribonuclease
MKYISIDIETSGLNPEKNKILSFGAIIEDTTKKSPYEELPKFNAIILQHEITGSPRAITMNKEIISLIGEFIEGDEETKSNLNHHSEYIFIKEDELAQHFYDFVYSNGILPNKPFDPNMYVRHVNGRMLPMFNHQTPPITINVAGKNFSTFDKLFIEQLPWWKKIINMRQRVIDPAILLCNWDEDESLPNMKKCKERSNLKGEVSHTALADAWDVVQMLRKFY